MSDLYQIANIGLVDARQRLEAMSMNAASASLTGYRRHVFTGRSFDAALVANDGVSKAEAAAAPPFQVELQAGAPMLTGRPLDLAVESEGAFFALTDGTRTWLTRAGNFRVNEEGTLTGEGGLRVIGTQGDIQLHGDDVQIGGDGRITQQGTIVGAVQLFKPLEPAQLQAAAGSLLVAPAGIEPVAADAIRVRSGTLEASNTDATREMLGLMNISRQFESLSRVLQSYDDLLGRAIQKLGEV